MTAEAAHSSPPSKIRRRSFGGHRPPLQISAFAIDAADGARLLFSAMRVDHSQAPGAFANDIESFLSFIQLERGLSKNTVAGYRRDLDQAAKYFSKHGARDWRALTPVQAGEWIRSLSCARYTATSLARKLTALRMLARHLIREKIRDDDFTALLIGPKLARKIPGTLNETEVAR